jgi:transposase-like protein
MTDARAFRGFRFPAEVILWAVRWYLQFPVSYRDLELMLADRGVAVDHTTMYRWVQRFAPELEKRMRRGTVMAWTGRVPGGVRKGWDDEGRGDHTHDRQHPA